MEERSGAHRVIQRLLGDPPESLSAEGADKLPEPQSPAPEAPADARSEEGVPSSPAIPRAPSDAELRLRQRAWRRERARFEASKPAPASADRPAT